MAQIHPFAGYRPKADLTDKVASKPYDVLSTEEAREEAAGNPNSFLRVIRSEIDFPAGIDVYNMGIYERARDNFQRMIEAGVFVQDATPSLYVYRITLGNHTQTGLVCGSSVEDYFNDVIKKHEHTREKKEKDRINHIKTTGIHSGPVFTTYNDVQDIDTLVEELSTGKPDVDVTFDDGAQHMLWVISDKAAIDKMVVLFAEKVPYTYIADGHHRAASSAKVCKELIENNPNHTGDEPYNYYLSVLFPASQLSIIDYNRVVNDLNGLTSEQFLTKLSDNFEVTKIGSSAYKPKRPNTFGLYLNRTWYKMTAKEASFDENDPVESLDGAIVQENVYRKIIGIEDIRTDERIDFVGGIRGLGELERKVNSGDWKAAFALYPVSIAQLIAVADSGKVMPPKTTWFEPKLKSGLVVNKFS